MSSILSTRKLTKVFAVGSAGVSAVKDLDLEIREGEFLVIMGSSGSGKSTLLYLLSGLDRPSSGEVSFRGSRIDDLSEAKLAVLRRRGMGFVFQNINLVPNLSLRENILLPGYLITKNRKQVAERAEKLLGMLGIGGLVDRLPSQASGGEQQRAAVARALINQPSVLFADEPTGALNYASGKILLDALNDVHKIGHAVVLVTHDLKAACRGERVVFLRDGGLVGEFRFSSALEAQEAREKELFAWLSVRGW